MTLLRRLGSGVVADAAFILGADAAAEVDDDVDCRAVLADKGVAGEGLYVAFASSSESSPAASAVRFKPFLLVKPPSHKANMLALHVHISNAKIKEEDKP
jgi:hypothetical protein